MKITNNKLACSINKYQQFIIIFIYLLFLQFDIFILFYLNIPALISAYK